MNKKKYTISFDKAIKSEKIIRKFLLKNSDKVRFTVVYESTVSSKNFKSYKENAYKNPKFIKLLNSIKKDLIKKTQKTGKFLFFKTHYEYYFYNLSKELKELINKNTLTTSTINRTYPLIYTEDPVFYKEKIIIGSVVSHEPVITLYLSSKEKDLLEKQGVLFD